MDKENYSKVTLVEEVLVGLPDLRGGDFVSIHKLQNAVSISASLAEKFLLVSGKRCGFAVVSTMSGERTMVMYRTDDSAKHCSVVKKYKDSWKLYSKNVVTKMLEVFGDEEKDTIRINATVVVDSESQLKINGKTIISYILFHK